ncbi:MAG TPA: HNH endonuclease [Gemmatimonadales bacterium]|jgi:hypothetical protein
MAISSIDIEEMDGELVTVAQIGPHQIMVDVIDSKLLFIGSWYICVTNRASGSVGYPTTNQRNPDNGKWTIKYLHRLVAANAGISTPKGIVIDHINGNKYDNRRKNLRAVTVSQNGANHGTRKSKRASGYYGVNQTGKATWGMSVYYDGKREYRGGFKSAEEAAEWRDRRLLMIHGSSLPVHNYAFPEKYADYLRWPAID